MPDQTGKWMNDLEWQHRAEVGCCLRFLFPCLHFQGLNFALKGDRIVNWIIYWRYSLLNIQTNEHYIWRHRVEMECTADVSENRVVSIAKDVRNAGIYSAHFQDAMNQK